MAAQKLVQREIPALDLAACHQHLRRGHIYNVFHKSYIEKSGDTDYRIGQHLIVTANDVLEYAEIIDTIGAHVISLANVTVSEEKKQQGNS